MSVAIYARVSTEDQNPELQIREMKAFCARKLWTNPKLYLDEGQSGGTASRPALDHMMRDVRAGKVAAVVVWKFDRFARSLPQLLHALREFKERGVDFSSVTESIDTTTPMGEMLFSIIGAFAQFERSVIRERVKAGLANARAMGKTLGRPRRTVDASEVANLRGQGRSWREISAELGIGKGTAQRAVQKQIQ